MRLSNPDADILLAEGGAPSVEAALSQVTHLCIAAHQDDVEIMAQSAIERCLADPSLAFGAVVMTDGAGSARTGPYSNFNDTQMREARKMEQREAARLGKYKVALQLAHPSADLRKPGHKPVLDDLAALFAHCRPRVLLTHNPADKHDTHVAVLRRCLEALKVLPREARPGRLLGCEVWRSLDWLLDAHKVMLTHSREAEPLARQLLACFDSQIAGGKHYDLAVPGRRLANATFHQSHQVDAAAGITWAMDLSPLLEDQRPTLEELTLLELNRFREDVAARLARLG